MSCRRVKPRESSSDRSPALGDREDDVAVVVQAKARVVRDLPRMSVEIPESTGIPSVEGVSRLACDRGSILASLLDHVVDLIARADVVSQGDTAPARPIVE